MTLAAVTIVKDEAPVIQRWLESVHPHVDAIVAIDTGSVDDTPALLAQYGTVIHEPWTDFSTARNQALAAGRAHGDWLLMLDADMTVDAHQNLRSWLDTDPDPDVAAWQVELREQDIRYRLPLLTRATAQAQYDGVTHEALSVDGKQRPLLGLSVTHHVDGTNRASKHERDLELLAEGVMNGDPRATYYSAQALKCLGLTDHAVELYARRAAMSGTWEEERWHAEYMAARLRQDVDALIVAHERREWRPEPLEWAARIVREQGYRDDVLFVEVNPCRS